MLASVTIRTKHLLDHASNHAKHGLPAAIAESLVQLVSQNDDASKIFAAKLKSASECTIVYHGCGSCAGGGALVEYFCNSSGGADPDYTRCEPC